MGFGKRGGGRADWVPPGYFNECAVQTVNNNADVIKRNTDQESFKLFMWLPEDLQQLQGNKS